MQSSLFIHYSFYCICMLYVVTRTYTMPSLWPVAPGITCGSRGFYSAAALLTMQSAVIATAKPSVCLSVCPSRAGIVPRRMKIESCGLHCEVANTNNGWGRRSLPPKIGGHSDPPPLKSADFDIYLLITSQP